MIYKFLYVLLMYVESTVTHARGVTSIMVSPLLMTNNHYFSSSDVLYIYMSFSKHIYELNTTVTCEYRL